MIHSFRQISSVLCIADESHNRPVNFLARRTRNVGLPGLVRDNSGYCVANFCTCCSTFYSAAIFHSVSFSKPNPVWFRIVTPKNCIWFSKLIPVWFGKKKMVLQNADSKPNSDWFGKFWWPLSLSWKFQTKFSLVWKNNWPNTQSSTARWADRDTPSTGHPCTAQRSPWCTRVQRTQSTLPSSQSSTPRNTQWRTLVSSHHGRLHAQHRCNALRTPLNI